jgi:hypothetical protein
MLLEWFRVWKYDGATFTDLSIDNQDDSVTIPLNLTTTDYLYLSQDVPFNNIYFDMNTGNLDVAELEIQYWAGQTKGWQDVVDILDATKAAGVTLSKSGVVQFSPNRDYGWFRVSDSSETYAPDELQGMHIYESYWLRIRPKTDLNAGTILNEITYSFTKSQELGNFDVEVNSYLDAFESGKTNWDKEIKTASKMLVSDLKKQGLVVNRGEILRIEDVSLACTYKTLELIYMNLGSSYQDKRAEIRALYTDALNSRSFNFDKSSDGFLNSGERFTSIKKLVR